MAKTTILNQVHTHTHTKSIQWREQLMLLIQSTRPSDHQTSPLESCSEQKTHHFRMIIT